MASPVMNQVTPTVNTNLPNAGVSPANPAVPAAPANSAAPATPVAPAAQTENNPNGDTFVNSASQPPANPAAQPVAPSAAAPSVTPSATSSAAPISPKQDIWAREANPGIPQAHAEANANLPAGQELAAASMQPGGKSLLSSLKWPIILFSGIALAGLALVKRKDITPLGNFIENHAKWLDDALDKYVPKWSNSIHGAYNSTLGKITGSKLITNRRAITNFDDLEKYAIEFNNQNNPKIRPIKIHARSLEGSGKTMYDAAKQVRGIAEDYASSDPKEDMLINFALKNTPEAKKHACIIRSWLNNGNVQDPVIEQLLNENVLKIEVKRKPTKGHFENSLGHNKVFINVGPPRYIDTRTDWVHKLLYPLFKSSPSVPD